MRSVCIAVLTLIAVRAAHAQAPVLSGYVQLRETYESDAGLSASVHRARVLLDGALRGALTYRLSADFSAESEDDATATDVRLADAYLRWQTAAFTVTAGQFKTPFAGEYLISANQLTLPDRSAVVDSLAPKRDIGVMGSYAVGRAAMTVGVFNGEGTNTAGNLDSVVLAVGRLTARPLSALTLGTNVAAFGADSTRYGADAALETGPVAVRAEYIGQHRDGVSPDDRGWYLLAAYRVTPAIQLVARQEDLQQFAVGPGARTTGVTGAANVDLSEGRVRLSVAYVSRASGAPAVRRGTLLAQLQLRF